MVPLPVVLATAGSAFVASAIVMAITRAALGTPVFFACAGVMVAAYATMIARIWMAPRPSTRQFAAALLLAVAFRIPLTVPPVEATSDMVRYLWDGRVQLLGFNPYRGVPADPSLAAAETPESRHMPSRHWRTPYPPGAQLFFRLVVALHDSTRAMRLALVGCDLLTILVVWRWLALAGRNIWLTLAYAWNPLVVLEVAYSGHLDALGALLTASAAYWLTGQRGLLASMALVAAIAIKPLPIVLVPLFWRRVRLRDGLVAAAFGAALALPFVGDRTLPLGSLPSVVAGIRFNGPFFAAAAAAVSPPFAAAMAIGLGVLAAAWSRRILTVNDPAAWAWPLALALLCAPVVYPWYLLTLTPFLVSPATLPLTVWTFSVLPVYAVWESSREGGLWQVPPALATIEYVAVAVGIVVVAGTRRRLREQTVLPTPRR
jgi:hypothetical protein